MYSQGLLKLSSKNSGSNPVSMLFENKIRRPADWALDLRDEEKGIVLIKETKTIT